MPAIRFRVVFAIVAAVCLFASIPSAALAAPGDLDAAFGSGGKVTTDFGTGNSDSALAVVVQADGKIVAAGHCSVASTRDFCLTRYSSDGSLDTSFDGDGKVTTPIGASSDQAFAVAVQADGKIVAAGYCWTGSVYVFCLARYNGNGSLDTSFDGDGKVTTAVDARNDQARSVAVQGDGKIVAAGNCGVTGDADFCLARYNSNGSLDTSFDGDGKVITAMSGASDSAFDLAVQGDGKIVAAGECFVSSQWDFCLARYSSNGSLDTSFDGDGMVTTAIGTGSDEARSVAVQADGKIVAAGFCVIGSSNDFCLARYSSGGGLDASFDGDGKVTTAFGAGGDVALAVAVQGDGKLVAAGICIGPTADFCLARYSTNGSLDASFDGDGKLITDISAGTDFLGGAAVQADGKIVAAGACFGSSGSVFCLARYSGAGGLDASWDGDGKLTTAIGDGDNKASALAVQADGKLVTAGTCWSGVTDDFCLSRYNGDGSLDTSFDGDGQAVSPIGASDDSATALAVQVDGKIVVAGWCWSATADFCLARYSSSGSLDTTFDTDGKVTTDFGADFDQANAVAVQADGKIVATGWCWTGSSYVFCLARYNSNGSLDTTFDGDGKVATAVATSAQATAVTVQADGMIVAAGYCSTGSATLFCLARYLSNGSLDTSFDGDGKVTTAVATSFDLANALAVQADGKIVAAGYCGATGSADFCVARYNSNGSLDTSFDGDGKVTTAIATGADFAEGVSLQTDGRIVVAGQCFGSSWDFCLARYNGNGGLDTSFDGDGKVTTAIGGGVDQANAVAVQPDGRIVAAGSCTFGLASMFCLVRYEGTPLLPVGVELVVKQSGLDPSQPSVWIDPAAADFSLPWQLGHATCLNLVTYDDETGVLGPDAAGMPTVSPDGTTYTFTIAGGHKFSDGAAVDAASFKRAIERATAPAMTVSSGGAAQRFVADIVGAAAHFSSGGGISGIGAVGNVLSITLAAAAGDFPARIAMPFFCATHPGAPATFSVAPLPSAGPYFVETATSGEIVLKQNPFYGGSRVRSPDTIRWVSDTSLLAGDFVPQPLSTAPIPPGFTAPSKPLGINYLALNTSKPPFSALNVRRAAALAVDRTATSALRGWLPTDQFLVPGTPGYQAASLYTRIAHTAGAIAELAGATPGVTLCHRNVSSVTPVATAVEEQLEAAGFVVTLAPLSTPAFFDPSPTGPGPANPANCDLSLSNWAPDINDPSATLTPLFRTVAGGGGFNFSFFDGREAAFAAAAANTDYASRVADLGALDVTLAGTDIPAIALGNVQSRSFFATRIGCRLFGFYGYNLNRLCVQVPGIAAPSNLTATAISRSQIELAWTDNATTETGFRIERSLDGVSGWRQVDTVAANVTAYTQSRQRALTTFFYRVRATNAVGDSPYSNVASATTLG